MKTKNFKKICNIVGGVLALISIVFVAFRVSKYWNQIPDDTFTIKLFMLVLVMGCGYGMANFILSAVWKILMTNFQQYISKRNATKIYGMTQLAKYVPGNIFQLVGRQALAMSYGFSGRAIAICSILELLFLMLAGVSFITWIVPLFFSALNVYYSILIYFFVVGVFIIVCEKLKKQYFISVFFRYSAFLIISGSIFLCILYFVADKWTVKFELILPIIGTYVIAWLAGFVTPGSPAGVGIREFVLILMLKPFFSEMDIVLAAVLGRVVTILGDCFYYAYSLLLKKEDNLEKKQP